MFLCDEEEHVSVRQLQVPAASSHQSTALCLLWHSLALADGRRTKAMPAAGLLVLLHHELTIQTLLPFKALLHVPVRKRVQCRTRDLHQSLLVKLNRAQLHLTGAEQATPAAPVKPLHAERSLGAVRSRFCLASSVCRILAHLWSAPGTRPGWVAQAPRRDAFGRLQDDLHIINAMPPDREVATEKEGSRGRRDPSTLVRSLSRMVSGLKEGLSTASSQESLQKEAEKKAAAEPVCPSKACRRQACSRVGHLWRWHL